MGGSGQRMHFVGKKRIFVSKKIASSAAPAAVSDWDDTVLL